MTVRWTVRATEPTAVFSPQRKYKTVGSSHTEATKKCSRHSSAAIFLVAMKRTLRRMKNEVAVGYEVLLRNTKNEKCALCFMAAKPSLHIGEANAPFFIETL